jgi:hypothetical protein
VGAACAFPLEGTASGDIPFVAVQGPPFEPNAPASLYVIAKLTSLRLDGRSLRAPDLVSLVVHVDDANAGSKGVFVATNSPGVNLGAAGALVDVHRCFDGGGTPMLTVDGGAGDGGAMTDAGDAGGASDALPCSVPAPGSSAWPAVGSDLPGLAKQPDLLTNARLLLVFTTSDMLGDDFAIAGIASARSESVPFAALRATWSTQRCRKNPSAGSAQEDAPFGVPIIATFDDRCDGQAAVLGYTARRALQPLQ